MQVQQRKLSVLTDLKEKNKTKQNVNRTCQPNIVWQNLEYFLSECVCVWRGWGYKMICNCWKAKLAEPAVSRRAMRQRRDSFRQSAKSLQKQPASTCHETFCQGSGGFICSPNCGWASSSLLPTPFSALTHGFLDSDVLFSLTYHPDCSWVSLLPTPVSQVLQQELVSSSYRGLTDMPVSLFCFSLSSLSAVHLWTRCWCTWSQHVSLALVDLSKPTASQRTALCVTLHSSLKLCWLISIISEH